LGPRKRCAAVSNAYCRSRRRIIARDSAAKVDRGRRRLSCARPSGCLPRTTDRQRHELEPPLCGISGPSEPVPSDMCGRPRLSARPAPALPAKPSRQLSGKHRRPRLPPRAALSRSRVHRALKPAYCRCNAGKLGEAYEDAADRRVGKSRPDSRAQAALPRRHAGHSRRSPSAAFERGSAVYRGKRCPRGTESLQTPRWREMDSKFQFRSILAPVFVESYSLVGAAGMRYRRPVSCRSLTVHGSPTPAIIHSRMAQRSSSTATSSMGSSASTTT